MPKGAGALGIDCANVNAKYRTLMPLANVSDQQIESSLEVIHDFANAKHVLQLTNLLHADAMGR
jgi:hypothetical protein